MGRNTNASSGLMYRLISARAFAAGKSNWKRFAPDPADTEFLAENTDDPVAGIVRGREQGGEPL